MNHLYKSCNILNTKLTITMPNPNHCWWKHSLRKWLNLVHFFLDKQSIFIYVLLTKPRSSSIAHILTMRESTNNSFISVSPRGQLMRPDCNCCLSGIFYQSYPPFNSLGKWWINRRTCMNVICLLEDYISILKGQF